MNTFLIFLVGAVVGFLVGKVAEKKEKSSILADSDTSFTKGGITGEPLIERQKREKEANKTAILTLLETNTPLTNNHIEQMLDIPESTVTRYMDELEKEGKVRQIGATGAGVRYERTRQ